MWSKQDIDKVVKENKLVVFAKGTREQPMCGFSHRAIHVMGLMEQPFEVVNIFDDPSIRPALLEYSGWPTTPQVFINGELVGGSDIVMEMYENGELKKKVEEGA